MIERSDKLNNQAILLASDGNYKEAIACFKRAIIIENNNYLLWYNLGITYADSGDSENSKNALRKAWEMNPTNDDVIETLATQCLKMGLLDETVYYCNYGLSVKNENSHLWNLLGVCFFKEEMYIEASESFEMAISLNPYYKDALFNLQDTYKELGNKIGAEEIGLRLKELR